MKLRATFLLAFSLLLCSQVKAQNQLKTDLPLPYLVQTPAGQSAASPMIILMHGYGSNEEDLFELAKELPKNYIVISVQAPIAVGNHSFQWFHNNDARTDADLAQSRKKMTAFITAATAKYHADAKQVYLSGFSQGAMMCYEVGLTAPQLLKGIAPLSGKIFESLKPQIKKSAALSKLRIFIGHGDADNRVPYSLAEEAKDYLTQLGLSPAFHTYKGMQHSINATELSDLIAWLNH